MLRRLSQTSERAQEATKKRQWIGRRLGRRKHTRESSTQNIVRTRRSAEGHTRAGPAKGPVRPVLRTRPSAAAPSAEAQRHPRPTQPSSKVCGLAAVPLEGQCVRITLKGRGRTDGFPLFAACHGYGGENGKGRQWRRARGKPGRGAERGLQRGQRSRPSAAAELAITLAIP